MEERKKKLYKAVCQRPVTYDYDVYELESDHHLSNIYECQFLRSIYRELPELPTYPYSRCNFYMDADDGMLRNYSYNYERMVDNYNAIIDLYQEKQNIYNQNVASQIAARKALEYEQSQPWFLERQRKENMAKYRQELKEKGEELGRASTLAMFGLI